MQVLAGLSIYYIGTHRTCHTYHMKQHCVPQSSELSFSYILERHLGKPSAAIHGRWIPHQVLKKPEILILGFGGYTIGHL